MSSRSSLISTAVAVALTLPAAMPSVTGAHGRSPRHCGRLGGMPVLAYNMSCHGARHVIRHLPKGWGGANQDVHLGHGLPNGIALLFRQSDMATVLSAQGRLGRPVASKLHGAPAVWFAAPYRD